MLTGLVSAEAAALLGYAPDGGIGSDTDFLEAGMDSVTAAELRGALRAATGLTLTTGVVFDHGTPARLATVLHEEFKRGGTDEHAEAVAADTPDTVPYPDRESVSGLLRIAKGMDLLGAVAAILPGFSTVAELGGVAPPVRLSCGPANPAPGLCALTHGARGRPPERPLRGTLPRPPGSRGAVRSRISAVTSRCRCPSTLSWTFSSRGRERRPATRSSSCWTPICRTSGATTTCGVRCSRECWTARTASAGSALHVWPP
ncbi:acyl carrier protein [Streptomyces niveus]|uniref:Acyl carrier protein n=1 Tax=Streptomyces niveus TaxID=193462 RepID=A0ABZ1ZW35_STRNV|nr:acyl carrier protein [Streptomyces niveus]